MMSRFYGKLIGVCDGPNGKLMASCHRISFKLFDFSIQGFLLIATQVTYSFCKEFRHLLLGHVGPDGDVSVTTIMQRLFDLNLSGGSSSKATAQNNRSLSLSQAYHRYALNYINALNYLESLRRHQEFCDFEKVKCRVALLFHEPNFSKH